MKELMKKMNAQKKEIRQYKKDYTESGELADPTVPADVIDSNYSDNEPVTKTSEEYERELAAAMEANKNIKIPEDGDVDFEG